KMEAVLGYALERKRRNVLDVGCGDGAVLEKLQGEFLVGLDLSLTRLERARSRVEKGYFICGDAEHLPFRESSFELALCLDTLEHLPHPLNCVRGLESSTAKGGLILVSVPDDKWLSLARLLAVRCPISLRGHGHIHTLKSRDAVELFKGCRLVSSCKIPIILPVITLLCMENS
ncbi:MAG: class I SAM-dependent methyltransferase, partial [Candidatus Bathyarchaeota archaeon]|nr:class I SAM-dependent methyltransferase [Candidatus Bathyarchaeota archaeon]